MIDEEENEIYQSFYLRPELVIRNKLLTGPMPVLLKPVNETKKRSIDAVFEEYREYDTRVLYIYRDPVNAFYSQTEMWPQYNDVSEFIQQWNLRNRYALTLSPLWKKRFAIVRYQDLSDDPGVFDQACGFFGIRGRYLFRADKNTGRARLAVEIRDQIDQGTKSIWEQLNQARSFLPARNTFSLRKIYRNTRFFFVQHIKKSLNAKAERS